MLTMRRPLKLKLSIVFSALVCACTPKFQVNGERYSIDEKTLAELQRAWKPGTLDYSYLSAVGNDSFRKTLDLIAFSEYKTHAACQQLALTKIVNEKLQSIFVKNSAGVVTQYDPQKYLETWMVDACGETHRWRVLDNPKDSSEQPTVLLYAKAYR